jgi:hypothetical protein
VKTELQNAKQAAFLSAYAATGVISSAAKSASVARSQHYAWLRDDPEYAEAFKQAHEEAIETLEAEVRQRALTGSQRPYVYQGEQVYELKLDENGKPVKENGANVHDYTKPVMITEPSDTLLMFLVKRHKPEYREAHKIEHSGPGGAPLEVTVKFVKPE